MLRVEGGESDGFGRLESALTLSILELNDSRLLFLLLGLVNRVSILVDSDTRFVLLLLDHLDLLVTRQRVPLHTIPHSIRLVVHIVHSISVHFGSSVNDLAGPDPFIAILLLVNEGLHIFNLAKVVHFECVFRIDFLQ